jgi:hypothetical protein
MEGFLARTSLAGAPGRETAGTEDRCGRRGCRRGCGSRRYRTVALLASLRNGAGWQAILVRARPRQRGDASGGSTTPVRLHLAQEAGLSCRLGQLRAPAWPTSPSTVDPDARAIHVAPVRAGDAGDTKTLEVMLEFATLNLETVYLAPAPRDAAEVIADGYQPDRVQISCISASQEELQTSGLSPIG